MRSRTSRLGALVALMLLGAQLLTAAPASADVIDDIRRCWLQTGRPGLSDYEVTGYGGSSESCTRNPAFLGTEVCLDYNGVTVATSCVIYGAGESGPTNPVACLPGVWLTQVTPVGIFGPEGEHFHSDPLIVTTQPCLER